MRIAALAIAFWFGCGFVAYGAVFAHFWHSYPMLQDKPGHCRSDMGFASSYIILGPIGLMVSFQASGFFYHGFKFTCHGKEWN